METVKQTTTTYINTETGKEEKRTEVRDTSHDCLAKLDPKSGVKYRGCFIYADGSSRDCLGGGTRMPPVYPEFANSPQTLPNIIMNYWKIKHEQLRYEFTNLKSRLKSRGESFMIAKNGNTPIDAFARLKELKREILVVCENYKAAEIAVEESRPQSRKDKEEQEAADVIRKLDFACEVDKINLDS